MVSTSLHFTAPSDVKAAFCVCSNPLEEPRFLTHVEGIAVHSWWRTPCCLKERITGDIWWTEKGTQEVWTSLLRAASKWIEGRCWKTFLRTLNHQLVQWLCHKASLRQVPPISATALLQPVPSLTKGKTIPTFLYKEAGRHRKHLKLFVAKKTLSEHTVLFETRTCWHVSS